MQATHVDQATCPQRDVLRARTALNEEHLSVRASAAGRKAAEAPFTLPTEDLFV